MKLQELSHRRDIGKVLNEMGLNGYAAEIGVAYGENALFILNSNLKKTFLIDVWETQKKEQYIDGTQSIDFDGALKYCKSLLSTFEDRIEYVKKYSDEAAKDFTPKYFDFIYLDGCHHNPQFKRDLDNWFPLLKKGGIFGGHDYYMRDSPEYKCEVESTVNNFVKINKLQLFKSSECMSWWIVK